MRCQVCDSSIFDDCSQSLVNNNKYLKECPSDSKFCSVCIFIILFFSYFKILQIFNFESITGIFSTKSFARSCAPSCNNTVITKADYSIAIECCQFDNCNSQAYNPFLITTTRSNSASFIMVEKLGLTIYIAFLLINIFYY